MSPHCQVPRCSLPGLAAYTWAACQLARVCGATGPSTARQEMPGAPFSGSGAALALLFQISNPHHHCVPPPCPAWLSEPVSRIVLLFGSRNLFSLHSKSFLNIKLSCLCAISSTLYKIFYLAVKIDSWPPIYSGYVSVPCFAFCLFLESSIDSITAMFESAQ